MFRQAGSNAVDVAKSVRDLIPTIQAQLPPSVQIQLIHDQSTTIVNSVNDIGAFEAKIDQFFALGGAPGRVQVRRVNDGALLADFTAFGLSYTGGVSVAVGDVNADRYPDLVVAARDGNPHVKVFDGQALATGTFNEANPDAAVVRVETLEDARDEAVRSPRTVARLFGLFAGLALAIAVAGIGSMLILSVRQRIREALREAVSSALPADEMRALVDEELTRVNGAAAKRGHP